MQFILIQCSCHRLQLASIQTTEIWKMFGMMTNLWKLFYYSPSEAEKLKDVQAALNLPVGKPSSTRWLPHERCMKALIMTIW